MEQTNILQQMARSMTQIVDHITKKYPQRSWMYEPQKYYWESACQAKPKGIPTIWHNQSVPPELLYAMDVVPMSMDVLSTSMASFHELTPKYLDIANKYVPDYVCSVNKMIIGLIMSGDIPKPDAMIYTSAPCDSAIISFPLVAKELDIPHFSIDAPFQDNERGYQYIATQLREALVFLEEVAGHKLDWSSMIKVIEQSNASYELFDKLAQLRKKVPCPLPGRLLPMNSIALGMSGSPQLFNYLNRQYEIGFENVRKNAGWLSDEKKRIAWIQNPIYFDIGITDWLEKEYGAIVAMDAIGFRKAIPINNLENEENVFAGLAKRSLMAPMNHTGKSPVEYWMESTSEVIRDYKCDMAIFAGHVGCTHYWAVGKLIKDMIYDNFGVKTLVFDVDALDPRYAGKDVVKDRIRDFMEING